MNENMKKEPADTAHLAGEATIFRGCLAPRREFHAMSWERGGHVADPELGGWTSPCESSWREQLPNTGLHVSSSARESEGGGKNERCDFFRTIIYLTAAGPFCLAPTGCCRSFDQFRA
jgi:hypothetical protein